MRETSHRRSFLRGSLLFATGAAGGFLYASFPRPLELAARAQDARGSAEDRLKKLGIELPPPPKPVAVYVPAVRVGDFLHTSGHGPGRRDGKPVRGKVGDDMSLADAKQAARLVGLNVLSSVRNTLGSLDQVVRLVKVLGMVNCTNDFTQQPQVINGFSELMVEVFGEQFGKGARSAVGMSSLPGNIPVEIEAIFQVKG